MAQRRMFSKQIVDSDAFLDMPQSSRLLYFSLAMQADDDGFVGNPKNITRAVGASQDDMKVLLSKRFILSFESGVIVIKHWRIHNYIQNDRYRETKYIEEKSTLKLKENGSYTECIQNVSNLDTQYRLELGKVRLGKKPIASQSDAEIINQVIKLFEEVNPSFANWYKNTTQRSAVDRLLVLHGFEQLSKVVAILPKTNAKAYFPTITTPAQLEERWATLESKLKQEKDKTISKGRGFVN